MRTIQIDEPKEVIEFLETGNAIEYVARADGMAPGTRTYWIDEEDGLQDYGTGSGWRDQSPDTRKTVEELSKELVGKTVRVNMPIPYELSTDF